MFSVSGGEIGIDEGGILEALSKPILDRTTVRYKYRTMRGHDKALLVKETTTHTTVSVTTIMSGVIMAAAIYLGPRLWDEVRNNKDIVLLGPFGLVGLILSLLWRAGGKDDPDGSDIGFPPGFVEHVARYVDPLNFFSGEDSAREGAVNETLEILKRVLDPFNVMTPPLDNENASIHSGNANVWQAQIEIAKQKLASGEYTELEFDAEVRRIRKAAGLD